MSPCGVADLGRLPEGLPGPAPAWRRFLPALAIAMVGLLESLMTRVADDQTGIPSYKKVHRLGLANASASRFGRIAAAV